MRIQIETSGHQFHRCEEGEVLSWAQTIVFHDGRPLQVPCVVILDYQLIKVVPLERPDAKVLSFDVDALNKMERQARRNAGCPPRMDIMERLGRWLLG